MKRILAVLAMFAIASAAFAQEEPTYVWNINWSLGTGYAESPLSSQRGVLDDFSVTWSLLYGDTIIDSATSSGTSIQWTDTKYSPTFSSWLDDPTDYVTYFGSARTNDTVSVYQRIVATDGTDTYKWESSTHSVTPVEVAKDNPEPWNVIIHSSDWEKVDTPAQVPEPATLSLLGIGALALALRRKLRK